MRPAITETRSRAESSRVCTLPSQSCMQKQYPSRTSPDGSSTLPICVRIHPLLDHDLSLGRTGGRLRLVYIHVHLVPLGGLSLNLFVLFLHVVFALALNVNAAVVRHLILVRAVGGLDLGALALDAVHLGILVNRLTVGSACS